MHTHYLILFMHVYDYYMYIPEHISYELNLYVEQLKHNLASFLEVPTVYNYNGKRKGGKVTS